MDEVSERTRTSFFVAFDIHTVYVDNAEFMQECFLRALMHAKRRVLRWFDDVFGGGSKYWLSDRLSVQIIGGFNDFDGDTIEIFMKNRIEMPNFVIHKRASF